MTNEKKCVILLFENNKVENVGGFYPFGKLKVNL